jgi:hypothetical protein
MYPPNQAKIIHKYMLREHVETNEHDIIQHPVLIKALKICTETDNPKEELLYSDDEDIQQFLGWLASQPRGKDNLIYDSVINIDGWQFGTIAKAHEPRSPLIYAVDGVFAIPSLNVVYGAPGTMKSMLLADMCMCVVSGKKWLKTPENQNGGIETKDHGIVWVDVDNGERRTAERVESLSRAHKVKRDAPFYYISMPSPAFHSDKIESIDRLKLAIESLNAKIVIVDNLGTVTGDAEENNATMGSVMANLRNVVESMNICLILIHHQRKSNGSPNGRAGDSLRGHSSIEASLDLALKVEREPHSQEISIASTKVRGVDVPPFWAIFSYEHKEGTKELHTARFWGATKVDNKSDNAILEKCREILYDDKMIKKTELVELLKIEGIEWGINILRNKIDKFVKNGDLGLKQEGVKKLVYIPD